MNIEKNTTFYVGLLCFMRFLEHWATTWSGGLKNPTDSPQSSDLTAVRGGGYRPSTAWENGARRVRQKQWTI